MCAGACAEEARVPWGMKVSGSGDMINYSPEKLILGDQMHSQGSTASITAHQLSYGNSLGALGLWQLCRQLSLTGTEAKTTVAVEGVITQSCLSHFSPRCHCLGKATWAPVSSAPAFSLHSSSHPLPHYYLPMDCEQEQQRPRLEFPSSGAVTPWPH